MKKLKRNIPGVGTVPLLGYGLMRLPQKNGKIDRELAQKLVLSIMDNHVFVNMFFNICLKKICAKKDGAFYCPASLRLRMTPAYKFGFTARITSDISSRMGHAKSPAFAMACTNSP